MASKKSNVIVIDDSEPILFLLDNILSPYFNVKTINNAKKALEIIDTSFDLIIIDLMMPEMNGIEFIKILRNKNDFDYIPIIVLTAKYNTEEDVAKLFDLGVNDYISKPFFSAELIARSKTHSKIKILTERLMEANKQLQYTATHDELTKVFNRNTIFDFLENEIVRLKRRESNLSLLMFDIDHFKKANDTYGHLVGDQILYKIIRIIRKIVRESDLIGRFGGDEFIIILPDTDIEEAKEITERLLSKIRKEKFKFKDKSITITISMGVTKYIKNETITKLTERVDEALYEAKNNGRDCFIVK